jgi:hypothetical protein
MTETQVFGWLADRTGCGQLRIMQPFDTLKSERGIQTDYNERILAEGPTDLPPTFVGQRVCKDGPSQLWFSTCVRKDRPRMVFEVDDDLWNIDVSNYKAWKWFIKGIDDENKKHDVQGNLRRNIAASDYVTCTTESLAEILRIFNPNVHIIPNYIPRWVTEWERPHTDELTIGWGGSGTHGMDWDANGPDIARYLKRSGMRFRLIGGGLDQARDQLRLPVDQVTATGWVQNVPDYWKTIDYDIGVIPLKPHLFNKSKSHLKYLENSALGIPTIAADAGPYSNVIKHGETGFLVKRDHEWAKYLRMLVEDEAARIEIGANAKAWAKTQILEDHLDEWQKVLCD